MLSKINVIFFSFDIKSLQWKDNSHTLTVLFDQKIAKRKKNVKGIERTQKGM